MKVLYQRPIIKGMDYSSLVKRIRETLLITQTELAEMLGVSFATVNRWENKRHIPTLKQKRALRDLCKRKKIPWEG